MIYTIFVYFLSISMYIFYMKYFRCVTSVKRPATAYFFVISYYLYIHQ